jgi:hypothetical protein
MDTNVIVNHERFSEMTIHSEAIIYTYTGLKKVNC